MDQRKRIALLVETSLGSGRDILRGIARYSRHHSDWEMFHTARGLEDDVPHWMQSWQGDGIIARIQNNGMAEKLKNLKTPVVDVLGVTANDFPLVHVDDAEISRRIADHFLNRDFRNFAFYGIEKENWSERRETAFRFAVSGMDSFSVLNARRGFSEGDSQHFSELRDWLRALPKPVAVMVCSDQRGLLLLEACRSAGIVVPEQVAVVGVDNDQALCEISTPNLSSIRGGHSLVGFEAAQLLDRLINGERPPSAPVLVPPNELVIRESSDSRSFTDPAVRKAVQFIRENLAETITNEQIARATGISKTRLQIRFRAATDRSLRDFVVEQRLARAGDLIKTTDLTFSDIAQRTGFRHHEYLGFVIKKHYGKTPRQLRIGV